MAAIKIEDLPEPERTACLQLREAYPEDIKQYGINAVFIICAKQEQRIKELESNASN